MRSRVLPARALTRLLTGQQQQTSSTSSTSSAATSATTSSATGSRSVPRSNAASSLTSARLSRSASRRRQESSSMLSASPPRRRRSTSMRTRPDTSAASSMVVVDPTKIWKHTLEHVPPMHLHGIAPVHPPRTSLTNVALQNFFAAQRPLLEHQVVPTASSSALAADSEAFQDEKTRSQLESISQALVRSLHQSGHLSTQDLDNATVVIAAVDDLIPSSHTKRVEGLDQGRFARLLDRLARVGSSGVDSSQLVQAEAERLQKEERERKDVEIAVNGALERGEDPSLAQKLGTEADLVILGEPDGANPAWARGVATYIAQLTRAYMPPTSAIPARAKPTTDVDQISDGTAASIKIIDDREDDPNLILSHAMVQATLPPALSWDRLVAKMEAASLADGGEMAASIDLSSLNANLTSREFDVSLDSTKRKRGKKMRKHKYRKLRKATRIERSRLKK